MWNLNLTLPCMNFQWTWDSHHPWRQGHLSPYLWPTIFFDWSTHFVHRNKLPNKGIGTKSSSFQLEIWEDSMVTKLKFSSWGSQWEFFVFLKDNLNNKMGVGFRIVKTYMYKIWITYMQEFEFSHLKFVCIF